MGMGHPVPVTTAPSWPGHPSHRLTRTLSEPGRTLPSQHCMCRGWRPCLTQEAGTSVALELHFYFLKKKNKNARQLFLAVPFLSFPCPDIVTMCKFPLDSCSCPRISVEMVWQVFFIRLPELHQVLVFKEECGWFRIILLITRGLGQ